MRYPESRDGGFVWVRKRDKGGGTPGHWRRLEQVRAGDVLVHYADSAVRAIGRATGAPFDATAPYGHGAAIVEGRRVDVEYFDLGDRAISMGRVNMLLREFDLEDGPMSRRRGIKQGYLWRFNARGLRILKRCVGTPWPAWADVGEVADCNERSEDGSAIIGAADIVDVDAGGEVSAVAVPPSEATDLAAQLSQLIDAIARRGFVYEPWQIAAFVTALRTKPFVILAGISGTGKSQLPRLVAEITACSATVIPVRPDWTDSSEMLGYVDLQNTLRPGPLLRAAEQALREPDRFHVCVVDEMNLARVEHYFAEVLSRLEGRNESRGDVLPSAPLISLALSERDARWSAIGLPPNLAIVGTVNMDESAQQFSRKVLDRAFTLELSDVDLRRWSAAAAEVSTVEWPIAAWLPTGPELAARATSEPDRSAIAGVVDALVEANAILAPAQLQIGYRSRDEIARFTLHAAEVAALFVTGDGAAVDPLDLALMMKLLPRVSGNRPAIRRAALGLLGFAIGGSSLDDEPAADDLVSDWRAAGRPPAIRTARFPRTAARLCLMWDRLIADGDISFWL